MASTTLMFVSGLVDESYLKELCKRNKTWWWITSMKQMGPSAQLRDVAVQILCVDDESCDCVLTNISPATMPINNKEDIEDVVSQFWDYVFCHDFTRKIHIIVHHDDLYTGPPLSRKQKSTIETAYKTAYTGDTAISLNSDNIDLVSHTYNEDELPLGKLIALYVAESGGGGGQRHRDMEQATAGICDE